MHRLFLLLVAIFTQALLYCQIPMTSFASQLSTSKGIDKLPPSKWILESGKTGEFDIDEAIYYQIRNNFVADVTEIFPLGCYLEKIEYIISFNDNVYGPFYINDFLSIPKGTRYSFTPRKLLQKVKTEVLDKLTSRNINELQIIFRGIWFSKKESIPDWCGAGMIPVFEEKATARIDNFILSIKNFGLIALVDASPLNKDGTNASLDVVSGIFKNLSKTSLDYVYVAGEADFSNLMVSVPFLKYNNRDWILKNLEMETVFVMDVNDKQKPVGYGIGIGFLGEKDKTLKTGLFWQDKDTNFYLGISIRGFANWFSTYK